MILKAIFSILDVWKKKYSEVEIDMQEKVLQDSLPVRDDICIDTVVPFYFKGSEKNIIVKLNQGEYDILKEVVFPVNETKKSHQDGLTFLQKLDLEIFKKPEFLYVLREVISTGYDTMLCPLYRRCIETEKRQFDHDSYDFVYRYEYVILLVDNTLAIVHQKEYSPTYEKGDKL
ncbi:hypothetical protein [Sulfurimonas sp.]|uniref:hypothetical protein n=1 Tax=Sulfurimonas sp. TaxID=2022749 RepID=UPI003D0F2578